MIKIKIIGPRFNRFLKRLNDNNINVYKIKNNINTVNENDLDKINNLKTIYDIEIIEYAGIKKIIKNINSIFVLSLIISIIFLYINSKMILNINIITDDYGIKKLLNRELKANNIKKYSFIKDNYDQIEKKIINNNKNKIEWLEIENTGTTINVKVQTRIINNLEKQKKPRNIIAKKNAILKNVEIKSGDIIRENNVYVKKGDVIVSGIISFNNINELVACEGNIYGEVWYKIKTSIPYLIKEEKTTNQKQKIIQLTFLNNKINLFKRNYNNYKNKELYSYKSSLFPLKLSLIEQTNVITNERILTLEEALELAKKKSRDKIKLNEKEYIISEKQLKESIFNSKIEIEMFYSVYEDITEYEYLE